MFKFVYLSISAGSLDPARRFHDSNDRLTGILLVWLVLESAFEARKSIAKTNRELMEQPGNSVCRFNPRCGHRRCSEALIIIGIQEYRRNIHKCP
jgi:hypothetical protein